MHRFPNLALYLGLLFFITLAACSTGDDSNNNTNTDNTTNDKSVSIDDNDDLRTSRLIQFNNCDTLLEHIHTEVAGRVGAYGFGNDYIEDSYDSTSGVSRADYEYSESYIPELDADKADVIQTDGERIFALVSDRLTVVDVASRKVIGSTMIAPGRDDKMFLFGDSLLVIQKISKERYLESDSAASINLSRSLRNTYLTVIQRIEIRNGIPKVRSTLHIEGEYVTSRSVNGIARVVLQSNPQPEFPFVQPLSEAGRSLAEKTNRRFIHETTLEDWLPAYDLNNSGWQLFSACENVHAPSDFSGFGVTTVLSLPIDGEINLGTTTAVLAPGDALYASTTSLYTASTAWAPTSSQIEADVKDSTSNVSEQTTSIHRFDITDPDKATYVSSGDIPGSLHFRFPLSEYDGHLRVVTTTSNPQTGETENQIRVLRTEGNQLVEVGQVDNIGQGEQVRSVRFMGDIGFLRTNTLPQNDSFYVIDLSSPTQPIIRGEFTIPGFSIYLHTINDNYLLTIGSDGTNRGTLLSTTVSLFDVSNLDNPHEVAAVWTESDVLNRVGKHDYFPRHNYFQWWEPENLAIIPVGGESTWMVVLKATADSLTKMDPIKHLYTHQGKLLGSRVIGTELWTYSWATVNDYYSVWLQVTDLNTLEFLDAIPLTTTYIDPVADIEDDDVVLHSHLIQFNDCDTLLEHIHTEAVASLNAYGSEGNYITNADEDANIETSAVLDSDESTDSGQASANTSSESRYNLSQGSSESTSRTSIADVEYSETDLKELVVDEADILKTDGERIFFVDAHRLVIVDVASRTVSGSTEIADGWNPEWNLERNPEMFLFGDSLLVIQQITKEQYLETDTAASEELISSPMNGLITVIQRIEVRDGTPEVVSTLYVEGEYISSRSINGIARVVLRSNPQQQLPFVYPKSEAAKPVIDQANRRAVLASTLEDWLPAYDLDDSGWQLFSACENVHIPSQFSGFGVTTVLNLPVDGEMDLNKATAVLAPSDAAYLSSTSLYTTSTVWAPIPNQTQTNIRSFSEQTTSIHRFDITDPYEATYVSSGDVPGWLHHQFPLSEYDSHLHVVTTTNNPQTGAIESQVRVLRTENNRLVEVGHVGNIGQIRPYKRVRFVGDIGFVMTFNPMEPFYIIDLSEPTQPIIRGEPKNLNFSSYLHPINDNYVLGVGPESHDRTYQPGTKVSLFDVSNLDNPREVAVWTESDVWHTVGADHRYFLWWAPKNLAVIPLYANRNGGVYEGFNGAVVLKVADGTITEVGRIKHADPSQGPEPTDCDRSETEATSSEEAQLVCRYIFRFPNILRSRVIGSELWTLSSFWEDEWDYSDREHSRLQVNHIDTLDYIATEYIH